MSSDNNCQFYNTSCALGWCTLNWYGVFGIFNQQTQSQNSLDKAAQSLFCSLGKLYANPVADVAPTNITPTPIAL